MLEKQKKDVYTIIILSIWNPHCLHIRNVHVLPYVTGV